MSPRPPLNLSVLRDIGWSHWDPIGLLREGEVWDRQPFADEYDSYLLQAAGMLRREWSVADAVEYLMEIEGVHMARGERWDSRARAQATAEAIRAYLDRLDAVH